MLQNENKEIKNVFLVFFDEQEKMDRIFAFL